MKFIIINDSTATTNQVLNMVGSVIAGGRISNGGYCYVTTFRCEGDESDSYVVYATKNKVSDTFKVVNYT